MSGTYDGRGSCYVQFGTDRVGRVDVDFLSGLHLQEHSKNPQLRWLPRRKNSGPVAGPAGSDSSYVPQKQVGEPESRVAYWRPSAD